MTRSKHYLIILGYIAAFIIIISIQAIMFYLGLSWADENSRLIDEEIERQRIERQAMK